MAIPTASTIQRKRRRQERLRQSCSEIIRVMHDCGLSLHCELGPGAPRWRLSDGSGVPPDVAMLVIASAAVTSVGDSLLAGVPAQTYRAVGKEETPGMMFAEFAKNIEEKTHER